MAGVKLYLGLGSNLGNRMKNLHQGLQRLRTIIEVCNVSDVYETEPWGYKDQPSFLNCVCEGFTSLLPRNLLKRVKGVEMSLGRTRTFDGGPRVFDADILFYGAEIIREPDLVIPHPRIASRAFVLIPLVAIAPGLVHPESGRTMKELLDEVDGRDGVRKWELPWQLGRIYGED